MSIRPSLARLVGLAFAPLLIAALCLQASVAVLSTLAADDYCYLVEVHEHGVVGAVAHAYQTRLGRFAQVITSGVLYAAFGQAAPLMGATLLIALAAFLARRLFGNAGLLLLAAFLAALGTHVWQGLYWLAGSATYSAPLVLALALMGAAGRKSRLSEILLAFVIAGFNESIGPMLVLSGLLYRRPALLLGAAIGTLIVFLAPGNAVRAAFFVPQGIGETLLVTGVVLSRFLTGALVGVPVALLGALVAGMMRPYAFDWRWLLVCSAALAAGIVPTLYLSGAVTPRVLLLPTAAIIGLVFHVGQSLGSRTPLSDQLRYAMAALTLLAAMNFASTAFASPQPFAERAPLDTLDSPWVRACAERLIDLGYGMPPLEAAFRRE